MSTQSWSSRIRHDSDATYQEWRDEFITKLNALSTWLTADETNITPAAGARPGTNTEQGYAVYHLNDTLHGTAPVYFRFGFGTGSNAGSPRVQITVGTSTNGSGVLGGTALAPITSIGGFSSAASTDTSRQSYFSANDGFLGMDYKIASGAAGSGAFLFCRSADANGDPTATGGIARWGSGSSVPNRTSWFRFASTANHWTATSGIDTQLLCVLPGASAAAGTQVGADIQTALCTMYTPRVLPVFGFVGVFMPAAAAPEVAFGSTLTATPMGSSARTYLVMTPTIGTVGAIRTDSGAGGITPAMLWE